MKRDLKLNMEDLSQTVENIQSYRGRLEYLETACLSFLAILKKQSSVSYNTLSEEWENGIIKYIDEMQSRLEVMHTMLSGYIRDMESFVSPESEGVMMRVDRNDIWWNATQIGSGLSRVFDITSDTGSSYADYKHFLFDWCSEEAKQILKEEEEEKNRRERNYNMLAEFRSSNVNAAFQSFNESMDQIWRIYNESLVPFENTDDEYSYQARFYYDMWATTGDKLVDLGRGTLNLLRGVKDGAFDMLDGLISLAMFILYESVPAHESDILPEFAAERARGMEQGIAMLFKDPMTVVEVMGQSVMDTYEEEGMAYAAGYIAVDVLVEILAAKGLGKAKGAQRTADTAEDASDVVRKAERIENTADAVDELDELERFYNEIFDAQRETNVEYEEFLDDLWKARQEGAGGIESGSTSNVFKAPEITTNSKGELTNGTYTLNQQDMLIHVDGKNPNKSQFLYDVDANKAVLDASAYADANNLWEASSGNLTDFANKAKVPVTNGYVGVTGKGELTSYINVYRTKTGYIHGCPGNP